MFRSYQLRGVGFVRIEPVRNWYRDEINKKRSVTKRGPLRLQDNRPLGRPPQNPNSDEASNAHQVTARGACRILRDLPA